jgi:glycine oxidase
MRSFDVIIAGGGVIGLTAAFRLQREGLKTMVVDSGAPAATMAAAGMLVPSFEASLHGAASLGDFGEKSLEAWRTLASTLEAESGMSIDFDLSGVLVVSFPDDGPEGFEADHEGGAALGAAQLFALEPVLSRAASGARMAPNEGQVDAQRARRALEIAFAKRGGALLRGKAADSLIIDGGRVSGVMLADGERFGAGAVIVATGAGRGLGRLAAGAIYPVKGEALALARPAAGPAHVIRTTHAYLCPKADGRLIVGATSIPHDRSLNTDEGRLEALLNGAVRAVPALEKATLLASWAGLRPATADGAPIIGRHSADPEGLFYALGHHRNGVLLAPATADALARLILGGAPDPALAALSPDRFPNPLGVC